MKYIIEYDEKNHHILFFCSCRNLEWQKTKLLALLKNWHKFCNNNRQQKDKGGSRIGILYTKNKK